MGLDLALIPVEYDSGTWGFGHSLIELDRTGIASTIIGATFDPVTPVPATFHTFRASDASGNVQYGDTQDTPCGERLTCVEAAQLLAFREHPLVRNSPRNRAAWAYLAELEPRTRIALYWH